MTAATFHALRPATLSSLLRASCRWLGERADAYAKYRIMKSVSEFELSRANLQIMLYHRAMHRAR